MGIICGVTTNPSLIAKGRASTSYQRITEIVDGPISGEVKATTTDAEGMIREGREIAKIHPNMVVKIPMTCEGLKAVKVSFQRRNQDKRNPDLQRKPGTSCCKSRRYLCISIPWKT